MGLYAIEYLGKPRITHHVQAWVWARTATEALAIACRKLKGQPIYMPLSGCMPKEHQLSRLTSRREKDYLLSIIQQDHKHRILNRKPGKLLIRRK